MSTEYPLIRDWLRLEDGRLWVRAGKVDIGQRISTALVRIAAEELCLSPALIEVAPVSTADSPDQGITSGSTSVQEGGGAIRLAAASLRAAVLRLAAARLETAPDALRLEDDYVIRPGTNAKIALLDLVAALDPDTPLDPDARPLPAALRRPLPALPPRGLAEMVTGAYRFLHDLDLPGMLHARTLRPPHARARLRGLDAGVVESLEHKGFTVLRDGSFLAIAGASEWQVIRAARRLAAACDWDAGAGLPEGDFRDLLRSRPATRITVAEGGMPDTAAALPAPLDAPQIAASFSRPYQLHAALAPSAALAEWRDGRLHVHSHSQGIWTLRDALADSFRLTPAEVVVTHTPGPGCYGHNGADDAALDAALVAQAVPGRPVLLKWTREEEHAWEPVAPATVLEVAAALDEGGRIAGFAAEAMSDTHRGRPRPGPNRSGPARLLSNRFRDDAPPPFQATPNIGKHAGIHRNLDPIYRFADKRLVKRLVPDMPLRSSAMRCLGAVINVLAIEAVMDEAAERAGRDPIAYRLEHLDDPRAIAVLRRLDALAKADPVAEGFARGIAYAQYKNQMTRVGLYVDLELTDAAEVRLGRVVMVADAGRVVDPDGLAAQLEGGVIQAASWTLYEEQRWDRDGVLGRDWDSYPVLRFDNVPQFETHLVGSDETPSVGAGEASPGPAAAAIANAIAAATGLRLRDMPFTPDAIRRAAMEA
ncbi:molybdopterin-dependent oxidoreductase [Halovulum dunhuangense]|uniref:Molybdopterin-dependent oxidoreductase n=1 Tax=Halovulum dunhuangense TaxID=1505036 RepID=A0A849L4H1_9RHOB|nr:molybdopterin cofactor-binding domain-containing protein [Halovulum dunhuangense]NNU81092.1 molybdopterin-dependent oxidoreductase [Halovulum dunhuangense]